jgi:hypothetical protein
LSLIGMTTVRADEWADVGDRYNSLGMHFHPYWVLPSVETGVFYDSNPNEQSGDGGSSGAYIAPNISAKSDLGRHALNFNAGAQHYEYFQGDLDPRTNIFGDVDMRLDIRRDLVLTSGLRGGYFEDDFSKPEDDLKAPEKTPLGAAEPVTHSEAEAWSGLAKEFNRLAVGVDGSYYIADYNDVDMVGGGTMDQDFRNHQVREVGARMGYLFSPGYTFFIDSHVNDRHYDNGTGDSRGWRALGGIEFELTHLLKGEAAVGYLLQDYDTGVETSDFSYHLGLIWNPTMLMTVRMRGDRKISESDVATSPGTVETSINAAVAYEVLRTLVVTPSAGASFDNYVDSSIESRSLYGGLAADFQVNRFLSLGFNYRFQDVEYSGSDGADYGRHVVGVNAQANF